LYNNCGEEYHHTLFSAPEGVEAQRKRRRQRTKGREKRVSGRKINLEFLLFLAT
jgi:hypothetical protein